MLRTNLIPCLEGVRGGYWSVSMGVQGAAPGRSAVLPSGVAADGAEGEPAAPAQSELTSYPEMSRWASARRGSCMCDRSAVPPAEESMDRLRRSGWCARDAGFTRSSARTIYRVDGRQGKNRIRTEGATPAAA
jgi:hypothetical protein